MPLEHTSDFEMSVPYGQIRGKVWSNPFHDVNSENIVRIIGKYIQTFYILVYFIF